jgi:hypothetical protein
MKSTNKVIVTLIFLLSFLFGIGRWYQSEKDRRAATTTSAPPLAHPHALQTAIKHTTTLRGHSFLSFTDDATTPELTETWVHDPACTACLTTTTLY